MGTLPKKPPERNRTKTTASPSLPKSVHARVKMVEDLGELVYEAINAIITRSAILDGVAERETDDVRTMLKALARDLRRDVAEAVDALENFEQAAREAANGE